LGNFLSRFDAPLLKHVNILFIDPTIFYLSQISQFIGRKESFEAFNQSSTYVVGQSDRQTRGFFEKRCLRRHVTQLVDEVPSNSLAPAVSRPGPSSVRRSPRHQRSLRRFHAPGWTHTILGDPNGERPMVGIPALFRRGGDSVPLRDSRVARRAPPARALREGRSWCSDGPAAARGGCCPPCVPSSLRELTVPSAYASGKQSGSLSRRESFRIARSRPP
jgi:hypothetical protein